ncbi:MAG: serine/threonine-protein kinase [Myxococcota bacterium]
MPTLVCPHCRASGEAELELGVKRRTCGACRREYWVSWAEPQVSRTPPAGVAESSGATVTDLGVGIEAAPTRVGRRVVTERPPADFPIEDEVTDKRLPARPARQQVPEGQRPTRRASEKRLAPPSVPEAAQAGLQLGGLQLLARIGSGGMGTVWLARQISLDRNVAVKVLKPALGDDPAFVIQFNREALAAAQLVHHNIVQIYDIGFDRELHYFSMEYVDGEPLSALVKREGRLDPEVAAGYVLQAARGLKFAHDRQMIHRDVKPENLLLNRDGIIKVADLGLVKRVDRREEEQKPSSTLTDLDFVSGDVVMGTPAYMAPEQVLDSKKVDARADIYSLGCSLYELLTGRAPFEGESTGQVLAQHVSEPPVPPEQRNHRVPPALSALTLQMMAKKPEGRLPDMGAVIAALERFLGVESGVFSPREEHAALLERSVDAFNRSKWAFRQRLARVLFVSLALAVVGGALALGFSVFALWAALFIVTSSLTSALINGVVGRSALLLRLRHLALGAPLWTWAVSFALLGLFAGTLGWLGHLVSLVENLALAAAVGLVSVLALDRRVLQERRPQVAAVEEMLKGMRLRGLEEQTLRQFVCRYSGERWEAFYEALFGYDAKLQARARWGRDEKGEPRKRYGAWRDPLIRFIDARLEKRRQRREAQQLAEAAAPAKPPPLPSKRPARAR